MNLEEDISQISKNVERAKKEYLGNSYLVLVAHHHWHGNVDYINHSIFAAKMTNIVVNTDNIIDWVKCYDDDKYKIPSNPKCYVFDITFPGIDSTVEMIECSDDPTPLLKHLHKLP